MTSTLGYHDGYDHAAAPRTTPEAPELAEWLTRMAENGCTNAVLEVSSQALAEKRTAGVDFDVAVLTNVRRDHLDYHGSVTKLPPRESQPAAATAAGRVRGAQRRRPDQPQAAARPRLPGAHVRPAHGRRGDGQRGRTPCGRAGVPADGRQRDGRRAYSDVRRSPRLQLPGGRGGRAGVGPGPDHHRPRAGSSDCRCRAAWSRSSAASRSACTSTTAARPTPLAVGLQGPAASDVRPRALRVRRGCRPRSGGAAAAGTRGGTARRIWASSPTTIRVAKNRCRSPTTSWTATNARHARTSCPTGPRPFAGRWARPSPATPC